MITSCWSAGRSPPNAKRFCQTAHRRALVRMEGCSSRLIKRSASDAFACQAHVRSVGGRVVVRHNARDARENALLLISLSGLGILPLLYVATAFPRFADYTFRPVQAWIGVLFAIAALFLFQMTHRALGRNWSITLQLRQDHQLITSGI